MADLTSTVYGMILLVYATFAASQYVLTQSEDKVSENQRKIKKRWNEIKNDVASYLEKKDNDDEKTKRILKLQEDYDTYENQKSKRSESVQYGLYASVAISAGLLFFSVLINSGFFSWIWDASVTNMMVTLDYILILVTLAFEIVMIFLVGSDMLGLDKLVKELEDFLDRLSLAGIPLNS